MIASQSSSSHPPISYPRLMDVPSTRPQGLQTRHTPQKSSLSGTMSWLARSTSASSPWTQKQPYAASKPVRISEPRVADIFSHQPSAPSGNSSLGSGAIVVRTPQEALATSPLFQDVEAGQKDTRSLQAEVENDHYTHSPCQSPLEAPPLPPKPLPKSPPNLPFHGLPQEALQRSCSPMGLPPQSPPPQVPPPPLPLIAPPPRPVLKPCSPPASEHSSTPPPRPPFDPILLSSVPTSAIQSSKIIVTLETSTESYRSTLSTLTSRQSLLSEYFTSLFDSASSAHQRDAEASSVYSQSTDLQDNLDPFNSIFHNHLAASGLLSQPSYIHIFLDRPSAPYTHILAYLRTPLIAEYPPTLPQAVQLSAGVSPSQIGALLELRDEANFLQLPELYKLCVDELRSYRQNQPFAPIPFRGNRNTAGVHVRGTSNISTGSNNSSAHTLDGIEEQYEGSPAFPSSLLHHIPTPNSSAPSSRADSGHESSTETFSHARMDSSLSQSELGKDGYATLKSRPPASWI